jgi:hypothetical protein
VARTACPAAATPQQQQQQQPLRRAAATPAAVAEKLSGSSSSSTGGSVSQFVQPAGKGLGFYTGQEDGYLYCDSLKVDDIRHQVRALAGACGCGVVRTCGGR